MISQLLNHLPGKPGEGLWYCISHYLGVASYALLLAGLGLALFTRWTVTGDNSIVVIALVGFAVFSLNVVLCYYFSFLHLASIISHVWFGCLLGLVSFQQWSLPFKSPVAEARHSVDNGHAIADSDMSHHLGSVRGGRDSRPFHFDDFTTNILLCVSLILQTNWTFFARVTRRSQPLSGVLTSADLFELFGMSVSAFSNMKIKWEILALTFSFALTLVLLRLKSSLGLLNLAIFILASWLYILPSLDVFLNRVSLICFCGRHLGEPLLDIYFNGLSPLERWSWFLQRHSFCRKFIFFLALTLQLTFVAFLGRRIPNHSSYLIMTPIFGLFAALFAAYHLIVFITFWCLMNKVTECLVALDAIRPNSSPISKKLNLVRSTLSISLSRIMASRGVRHMSLIARRLGFISAVTTLILILVAWRVRTSFTLALSLSVLPWDLAILSLAMDLSSCLGGTCAGFSLVIPSLNMRSSRPTESFPTILAPHTIEVISKKATTTLNLIQRFFAVHLIENCGSEYSSSGLSIESLTEKLKKFFEKKTDDDLPFDTYFLYYSGPTHASGDWAVLDNGVLTLQSLLDLWWAVQGEEERKARLVVVVDSEHAHKWKKQINKTRANFVALQTFYPCCGTKDDVEGGADDGALLTFTKAFVSFNTASDETMGGADEAPLKLGGEQQQSAWFADFVASGIRPTYAVSQPWADFAFRLPSMSEFEQFSAARFPRLILPLLRVSSAPFIIISSLCCCFERVWRMARRCKLAWFPPAVLNLGHDFKLIKC